VETIEQLQYSHTGPLTKPIIEDVLTSIIRLCQLNIQNQNNIVQSKTIFPFLRNLFEHIQLSNNIFLITLTLHAITALIYDNKANQILFGSGKEVLGKIEVSKNEDEIARDPSFTLTGQCEMVAILIERFIINSSIETIDKEMEDLISPMPVEEIAPEELEELLPQPDPNETQDKEKHNSNQDLSTDENTAEKKSTSAKNISEGIEEEKSPSEQGLGAETTENTPPTEEEFLETDKNEVKEEVIEEEPVKKLTFEEQMIIYEQTLQELKEKKIRHERLLELLYEALVQVIENLIVLPDNKHLLVQYLPNHYEFFPKLLQNFYERSTLLTEHLLVIIHYFVEDALYYWSYSTIALLDNIKQILDLYYERKILIVQHAAELLIELLSSSKKQTAPAGEDSDEDEDEDVVSVAIGIPKKKKSFFEGGQSDKIDILSIENTGMISSRIHSSPKHTARSGLSSQSPSRPSSSGRPTSRPSSQQLPRQPSTRDTVLLTNTSKENEKEFALVKMDAIEDYIQKTLLPHCYFQLHFDDMTLVVLRLYIESSMSIVEVTLHVIVQLLLFTVPVPQAKIMNKTLMIDEMIPYLQRKPEYAENAHIVAHWLQLIHMVLLGEEKQRPHVYYNLYEYLLQPVHYIRIIIQLILLHQMSKNSGNVFHYGIGNLLLLAGEHDETWIEIAKEDGISVLLLILQLKGREAALPIFSFQSFVMSQQHKRKKKVTFVMSSSATSSVGQSPNLSRRGSTLSTGMSSSNLLRRMSSKALLSSSASTGTMNSPQSSLVPAQQQQQLPPSTPSKSINTEEDSDYTKHVHQIQQFYKPCEKSLQALAAVAGAHITLYKTIENMNGIPIIVKLIMTHGQYSKEVMMSAVPMLSRLYQNRSSTRANQYDDSICEQFLSLLILFFNKWKQLEESKRRLKEESIYEMELEEELMKSYFAEEENALIISLTKCLEVISVLSNIPTNANAFRQSLTIHKDLIQVIKKYAVLGMNDPSTALVVVNAEKIITPSRPASANIITANTTIRPEIVILAVDIVMHLIAYDPGHHTVKFLKEGICKVFYALTLDPVGKFSIFMTTKVFEAITILSIEHREMLGGLGICERIITLCRYFLPLRIIIPGRAARKPRRQSRYHTVEEEDDEEDDPNEFKDYEERSKALNEFVHQATQAVYNLCLTSMQNKYRFLDESLHTVPYFMAIMRNPEILNHIKQEVKDAINMVKFE
jgi:hypothetical protein